jgi:hypothetical protein
MKRFGIGLAITLALAAPVTAQTAPAGTVSPLRPVVISYPMSPFSVSAGVATLTLGSSVNEIRVPNGAGPEYGQLAWVSNFFNVGTVTNSGTVRTPRLISSSTQVILAPSGSDAYVFTSTGATKVAGVTAVGLGTPVIVADTRSTGVTNQATASVATFTVGAADGTFEVSANVLVTTSTTHSFTVECAYTDEGNTARTITLPFRLVGDTTALTSSIAAAATVPYNGVAEQIRAKAATTITIRTQAAGTYTAVVYNVEGLIKQIS